jgi:hypothetical protein
MRSRLEARWAAMFDALGWPWRYEPIDLAGYIPDFILEFDAGPLLVECKPALELGGLKLACNKIAASGWQSGALILGASLHERDHCHPVIGLLGEPMATPDGLSLEWSAARMITCLCCGKHAPISEDYSWACRSCGESEGHMGAAVGTLEAWGDAGNRVQWRAA